MTDRVTVHAFVSGKVQGVFYRHHTKKKAIALGLTGWVKNLPDRRVELVVSGDEQIVSAMMEWLWEGSPSSQVTEVEKEVMPFENFGEFRVAR